MWTILLFAACNSDFTVKETPGKLTVEPALLDMGVVLVSATGNDAVTLTHSDGPPVQIYAVELINVEGNYFATQGFSPIQLENGGDTDVQITYIPTEAGFHRATMTVRTDAEGGTDYVVELRGQATEPQAAVWPVWIDFGPVVPGDSAMSTVYVRNDGLIPIDINSLNFDGTVEFSSSLSTPTSIVPGDTLEVPLTYTAGSSYASSCTLSFSSNLSLSDVALLANDCENGAPSLYDADEDGATTCGGDCDDADPAIHAGVLESCDSVDNDCDGITDEGTECYDDDGDGLSEVSGDCNDGDNEVYPGQTEDDDNGIDDDCDGVVDSGAEDPDGDGYLEEAGDCGPADGTIWPGAPELEDGIDNDCDGIIDEGTTLYDDDGDGQAEVEGDCDDSDTLVYLGASELPDWIDNDCDTTVDEGTTRGDDDGDGYSEVGGDCDDANATISPAASETTGDGVDNNCDGVNP